MVPGNSVSPKSINDSIIESKPIFFFIFHLFSLAALSPAAVAGVATDANSLSLALVAVSFDFHRCLLSVKFQMPFPFSVKSRLDDTASQVPCLRLTVTFERAFVGRVQTEFQVNLLFPHGLDGN